VNYKPQKARYHGNKEERGKGTNLYVLNNGSNK
jgi:hypothetical protein